MALQENRYIHSVGQTDPVSTTSQGMKKERGSGTGDYSWLKDIYTPCVDLNQILILTKNTVKKKQIFLHNWEKLFLLQTGY